MIAFEQFERFILCIRSSIKERSNCSDGCSLSFTGTELITTIIKFLEKELNDKYEYIYSWIYDCEEKQMTVLEDGKPIYIDNDKDLYDYLVAHLPQPEQPVIKGKKKK